MTDFATIPELIAAAKRKLAPEVYDYCAGGAETEATLRRNRMALEQLYFRPRVLRDVSQRSVETNFLGYSLNLPVMLAPIGSIHRFHKDGALASARAARHAGTIAFVGTLSEPSLETVAEQSQAPLVFQLYVRGDRDWVRSIIRRVEAAGYIGLCVTVDTPLYSRRERDLVNRIDHTRAQPPPNLAGIEPDEQYGAQLTWEYIDWLRHETKIPLILKGIMTPEDAELAVALGVDVIYVSNHGGRQLDFAPAAIEVLTPIVQAVAGKARVIVDSGFLRGTDVVKAIALGADAVLIGKLHCWGLAADGVEGLQRVLQLLHEETSLTLGLLGVTSLAELSPEYVTFAGSLFSSYLRDHV